MYKKDGGIMLPVDNDIRKEILAYKGNIVISASAGTGKTHTTVMKILDDIESNKSFRTFASITFTRKAAKEISKRLSGRRGDGFVGTNDFFVWDEIIQPFMYDVYGEAFKKKISPDYTTSNNIQSFEEGIERIRETGFMCKYNNNHNNFPFQLALQILQYSKAARRYIKSRYFKIYIDEYQDCDSDMHNLFMFLADEVKIPLFVVGDLKQSIYGWRGAYSDGFKELFRKDTFKLFELWHNFRSNIAIQNYSNVFMESVREHYIPIDIDREVVLYSYKDYADACEYVREWINLKKNCSMLNFRNGNAREWSEKLNEVGLEFVFLPQSPIDDTRLESEHIWIARGVACYILTKRYSEYDFFDEIPSPESYQVYILRDKLKQIKNNIIDRQRFEKFCIDLYCYLGYDEINLKVKEEIDKLFQTVCVDEYYSSYNADEYNLTSGSIHSSKGLEFSQVIINAGDFDLSRGDIKDLHYVAVSRPEDKLLILAHESNDCDRYLDYINQVVTQMNSLGYEITRENLVKIDNRDE
jgi:superfamily I DNA/RNA helicase